MVTSLRPPRPAAPPPEPVPVQHSPTYLMRHRELLARPETPVLSCILGLWARPEGPVVLGCVLRHGAREPACVLDKARFQR